MSPKPNNPEQPEFWDTRFQAGRTPWDLGRFPQQLCEWLEARAPGKVMIPGCGCGWEIEAFEKSGWLVTAVDFSKTALDRARSIAKAPATRLVFGDFFKIDPGTADFDAVYERTFICSMPPGRWTAYADRVARHLKPGGLLAGFFLYGSEEEPPPFPIEASPSDCFLSKRFELVEDAVSKSALPIFTERERWQVWKAR